jgi:hypothetical protein
MPEISGRDLIREWRKVTDAMLEALSSVTGRSEIPRQIAEPMQRQLELVQDLIERERRLQAEAAQLLLAPSDIAFDLLEQSGATMRRQAEALSAAGDALRETAGLMESQAEIFEQTIGRLRAPAEAARTALGAERRPAAGKRASAGTRKRKR